MKYSTGAVRPVPAVAVVGSAPAVASMAAVPVFTLLDLVSGWNWPIYGMAAASCAFLVFYWGNVPTHIRRTSLMLVLFTAVLVPLIAAPLQTVERGLRIGCLIASLLMTVSLLSRAALRVPRVRDVVGELFLLPAGRRYVGLTVASQFFGGLLGLAGLAMMMEVASSKTHISEAEKISDFTAISRGYAALSLWSPMYSNLSIVLALYPGSTWLGLLPYALVVSALLMALGAVLDWLQHRGARQSAGRAQQSAQLLGAGLPVVGAMLGFLAFMVVASLYLHLPITAAIIVGAPIAAWLLNSSHSGTGVREGTRTSRRDFLGFQSMAGEAVLFLASGCAGTVIASAIPAAWTGAIGYMLGGSPFLGSLFLSVGIVLLSATAIHPMLSAVLMASSFPPALLGLPLTAHLCAVLVGWGLAIIVTPFSVLSLMASRASGIPIFIISLRANALFVVISALVSALILGSLARLVGV